MSRHHRSPRLRALLPLAALLLAAHATFPATSHALSVSSAPDVLERTDMRVSLATSDPVGLATLYVDGVAVRTTELVASRSATLADVSVPPGAHTVRAILRTRTGLRFSTTSTVRGWTRPNAPRVTMPACGLVGRTANLAVGGDSATTKLGMRLNGGPATIRAVTPRGSVTFGPFEPRRGTNTVELTAGNPAASTAATVRLRRLECWPTPGCTTLTSPFGWRIHPITGVRKLHTGVDIGAGSGNAIVAVSGGVVTLAGWNGGYGTCVIVDHGDGITTLYGHQSRLAVSRGQRVNAGQTIGYVGSTGLSTGPHLHLELRLNGAPVDPMGYL